MPAGHQLAAYLGEIASWIVLYFGAQWIFNFAYRDLRDDMHAHGETHPFELLEQWRRSQRPRATVDYQPTDIVEADPPRLPQA